VLLGVFMVIAVELLGIRSLSFAVGSTSPSRPPLAIFMRRRRALAGGARAAKAARSRRRASQPGSLYASGLIAGRRIVGSWHA
jgi:hypothetical protein